MWNASWVVASLHVMRKQVLVDYFCCNATAPASANCLKSIGPGRELLGRPAMFALVWVVEVLHNRPVANRRREIWNERCTVSGA